MCDKVLQTIIFERQTPVLLLEMPLSPTNIIDYQSPCSEKNTHNKSDIK